MATPEPHPYRQLNYPVNNLEQNFDQTKKIQVRANIGIPTSVDQTNKVLGVTAATGELGWVPQSGGSRLYIPENWFNVTSANYSTTAAVSSDHLSEVAAFLSAHSDILATVFFTVSSGTVTEVGVNPRLYVSYVNTISQIYTSEKTPFRVSTDSIDGVNTFPKSGSGQNLVRSNIDIESATSISILVNWSSAQFTATLSSVLLDALT